MAAGLGKLTGRLVFFPGMDEDQAAELTAGHDLGEVEFELVLQPQPVKRGDLPLPRSRQGDPSVDDYNGA